MELENLEMKIETALFRIKDLYDRTNGKCVLSFSGGKDSTIVAHFYLEAMKRGMVGDIPFIFADTQVEYGANYDFIKWFDKNVHKIIYLKPEKTFSQVLKQYGKPIMSKQKSDFLRTYHRVIKGKSKIKTPLESKRIIQMLTGHRYKTLDDGSFKLMRFPKGHKKEGQPEPCSERLGNKHFNFLHPDHEYQCSQKCCGILKKDPFELYYIENNIIGYYTGMRPKAEGGVRAAVYKSCTAFKTIKNKKQVIKLTHKMPLFDWAEEDIKKYIKMFNVKISIAYTKYGLKRTGCFMCPFPEELPKTLRILYEFEPKQYKAALFWLGDVYMDLEVELPFDKEYMEKYHIRHGIVKTRRLEMLKHYEKLRPTGYKRAFKNDNQTTIFEFINKE